jgi:hypothetical protein
MKIWIVTVVIVTAVTGCSYSDGHMREYLDNPETILRDPGFTEYEESLNKLESRYLNGEITYAEYMSQKKEVENKYNKEVQERTEIIEGQ